MITKELMQEIFDNKGATILVEGPVAFNTKYTEGYAVSIKGHELITDTLTDKLLEAYIDMNAEYIEKNPAARVGVWFNPENKKIYLDISLVTKNIYNAMDKASMNDQMAIYDFKRGASINRYTLEVIK
jgi:transcriptional/translational regulatory protein YebC/TACO1